MCCTVEDHQQAVDRTTSVCPEDRRPHHHLQTHECVSLPAADCRHIGSELVLCQSRVLRRCPNPNHPHTHRSTKTDERATIQATTLSSRGTRAPDPRVSDRLCHDPDNGRTAEDRRPKPACSPSRVDHKKKGPERLYCRTRRRAHFRSGEAARRPI